MALDNLKEGLPEYAKDLKLNLDTLSRSTELSEQQLWGTFLATAAATRNDTIISEIAEEASQHLSDEYVNAAYGAASIMAMNNVAYRAKSFLGSDYAQVRMGLRMNVIGNPGVDKVDFELWSLAVSAVNGCGMCIESHEHEVVKKGVSKEAVQDVIRIASVIHAVSAVIDGEDALA